MNPEPRHFADRLLDACDEYGPVCVGLDPVLDKLPAAVQYEDPIQALQAFSLGVIEAVAGVVPCIKIQAACFERFHAQGVGVFHHAVQNARRSGLIVIADAKRGDIGISNTHYAAGLLGGPFGSDALTVSPYLGVDALAPYLDVADDQGCGLFSLVRTSNPEADALQSLELASGLTLAQTVADQVHTAGRQSLGTSGYSALGAVVGATKATEIADLRQRMAQQIFLVPGYGAQGGTASDIAPCFDAKGHGALITASRSVIYAQGNSDWKTNVRTAAEQLRDDITAVLA